MKILIYVLTLTLVGCGNSMADHNEALIKKIIDDILAGIKVENDCQVILDRKKAITSAVTTLDENEVLLIAGKGHETTQIIGSQILPFSDIEVALNALI